MVSHQPHNISHIISGRYTTINTFVPVFSEQSRAKLNKYRSQITRKREGFETLIPQQPKIAMSDDASPKDLGPSAATVSSGQKRKAHSSSDDDDDDSKSSGGEESLIEKIVPRRRPDNPEVRKQQYEDELQGIDEDANLLKHNKYLTEAQKKTHMRVIYSRRKRLREKQRREMLSDQVEELRIANRCLKAEGERLTSICACAAEQVLKLEMDERQRKAPLQPSVPTTAGPQVPAGFTEPPSTDMAAILRRITGQNEGLRSNLAALLAEQSNANQSRVGAAAAVAKDRNIAVAPSGEVQASLIDQQANLAGIAALLGRRPSHGAAASSHVASSLPGYQGPSASLSQDALLGAIAAHLGLQGDTSRSIAPPRFAAQHSQGDPLLGTMPSVNQQQQQQQWIQQLSNMSSADLQLFSQLQQQVQASRQRIVESLPTAPVQAPPQPDTSQGGLSEGLLRSLLQGQLQMQLAQNASNQQVHAPANYGSYNAQAQRNAATALLQQLLQQQLQAAAAAAPQPPSLPQRSTSHSYEPSVANSHLQSLYNASVPTQVSLDPDTLKSYQQAMSLSTPPSRASGSTASNSAPAEAPLSPQHRDARLRYLMRGGKPLASEMEEILTMLSTNQSS
jgi:hypothetical protein